MLVTEDIKSLRNIKKEKSVKLCMFKQATILERINIVKLTRARKYSDIRVLYHS